MNGSRQGGSRDSKLTTLRKQSVWNSFRKRQHDGVSAFELRGASGDVINNVTSHNVIQI